MVPARRRHRRGPGHPVRAAGGQADPKRDLVKRTRKLRDSAEDVVEEIASEVQSRGRRIKETVAEFADEVMEEVQDGKRKVEAARASTHARDAMEQRLAQARSRARARAAVPVGGDDAEDDDESA